MASAHQSNSIRCDSGVGIDNYTKYFEETLEPYECAVAGDSATNDSGIDRDYNSTFPVKRTLSDVSLGWPEASEIVVKKSRYNQDTIKASVEHPQRVLCPFYMRNPDMDAHRVSCYNKGFNEMARLKQHLVKEHKVPLERLDYFKEKCFRNLGSLEAKWVHVYCTLFPDETKEDIPSPYKTAVPIQRPSAILSASPATKLTVFEDITARYNCEPGFAAAVGVLCNTLQTNKSTKFSASQNNSLPTPPSSAETSPELGTLETSPVSELISFFLMPATNKLPNKDFVDPSLFADQNAESKSSYDIIAMNHQPVLFNSTAPTAQPVIAPNACLDCFSKNIFKTTGSGPSIYVCGNCHSTDVEYCIVTDAPEESAQHETSLSLPNMSAPTTGSPPNSEKCELVDMLMGANEGYDLDLEGWTVPEDSCHAPSIDDIENVYGDVDELFEF